MTLKTSTSKAWFGYPAGSYDGTLSVDQDIPSKLHVLWKKSIGKSFSAGRVASIVPENRLFVTKGDKHFICLDHDSGETIFELKNCRDESSLLSCSPWVFFENKMTWHAIDGSAKDKPKIIKIGKGEKPVGIYEDVIITKSKLFDLKSLKPIRSHSLDATNALIRDDTLIVKMTFPNSGPMVSAFKLPTFEKVWEIPQESSSYGTLRILQGNRLLVSTNISKGMACIDSQSGKKIWESNFQVGGIRKAIASNSSRFVIANPSQGDSHFKGLMCIDLDSGKIKWKVNTIVQGAPVSSGNSIWTIESPIQHQCHSENGSVIVGRSFKDGKILGEPLQIDAALEDIQGVSGGKIIFLDALEGRIICLGS